MTMDLEIHILSGIMIIGLPLLVLLVLLHDKGDEYE